MGNMDLFMTEFFSELESGITSLNFSTSGLGVIVYVLQALALYTIAKRRGIQKPWLAWIPLVNVWILGSISDQYQYVVKRQVKNKRKVLLGLNIALLILIVILVVAFVWTFIDLLFTVGMEPPMDGIESPIVWDMIKDQVGALLIMLFALIPLSVLTIVHAVFFYMAMYDVFRSCEPKNSTLYLVLSLVGNIVVDGAYCIFLMLCKDKDLGMPPRKAEVVTPPEIPEDVSENAEEAPVNTEE